MAITAMALSVAIACSSGFIVIAQESPAPAVDPLLGWMNGLALQLLQQRESRIAQIRSVDDAERRKSHVRQTLLDILGGLPKDRCPLNARVTGRTDAGSYIIEKIIFESLPHFFVTANLYRPAVAGRYPAVLLQSGHTQEVKEVFYDCDGDALLVKVDQKVAACHEGYRSCFFRKIEKGESKVIAERIFDPKATYKK